MPWTCPKSWPRRRCSLREGGGGSISRAVAHFSDPNVTVQGARHLVEGTLEPLVRCLLFVESQAYLYHKLTKVPILRVNYIVVLFMIRPHNAVFAHAIDHREAIVVASAVVG